MQHNTTAKRSSDSPKTADLLTEVFGDENNRNKSVKDIKEKDKLVPAFLKLRGLVKLHIDSFNHFINVDIKNIVKANSKITCDADPTFYVKYKNIYVGKPDVDEGNNIISESTPHQCRLRDITYAAPISVDIEYTRVNERVSKTRVLIGRMPIMLKSSLCVLKDKTEYELSKMNECPLDPGGYFITRGQEKVILLQEQLVRNRMMVEEGKWGMQCQVTSSTQEKKSRTLVFVKNNIYYMQHHVFKEPIPVSIAMKAMGVLGDYDIVGMIDPIYEEIFLPTIELAIPLYIYSADVALEYMGSKLTMRRSFGPNARSEKEEARELINSTILAHVPAINYNFRNKALYLALMTKRVIQAEKDKKFVDDKDYYGNKRMETSGSLMALMFEDAFKRFNFDIKMLAERTLSRNNRAEKFDIVNKMKTGIITAALESAISTGNWTIKRFRMERVGVTQVLSRLSYISSLGMMTRIHSQFESTRKVSGPRSLHGSQWGMVCPCDTPEGESCGLVKNLAILAHVTTDVDDFPVRRLIRHSYVDPLSMLQIIAIHEPDRYLVFVNGTIEGVTIYPYNVMHEIRMFRRLGRISCFVSVHLNERHKCVYVNTDGGRICRPYIIVEKGQPLVKEHHIEELKRGIRGFDDFVKNGLVEFLDVNEESNAYIACFEQAVTPKHTHLEIACYAILGVCAGLIPYPNHNQSPRNTYQCAMGKQAMGCIGYNQRNRMDTLQYNLVYPQKPIVSTKILDLINFEKVPAGHNAVIAVMSYTGYDIEDALILNKASIDRGFGRCMVYRTSKCVLRSSKQNVDRIQGPVIDTQTNQPIMKHRGLDSDGIICPGQLVENKQVLVNRSVPTAITMPGSAAPVNYKDNPLSYRNISSAHAERVLLTGDAEDNTIIKVLLRQTRRPEVGDKFSSRHGQKGVIGFIAEQEDMPFNEEGIVPDVIMNPHGFPSRMTVGKLIEILSGKLGALEGRIQNATAFEKPNMDSIGDELMKYGYHYEGKDLFYSATTGQLIPTYIYSGTVYYQKLKHMVEDKIHARARGPTEVLTRQPTEGRSRDGGLRLGEMERDCLIGYGASMMLIERLCISSDRCDVDVCNECGRLGYEGWCKSCNSSNVSSISMPYGTKLLFTELQAMNISPRLTLKKSTN